MIYSSYNFLPHCNLLFLPNHLIMKTALMDFFHGGKSKDADNVYFLVDFVTIN